MAFGPESTNPRERRAYADALIQRALATGNPEDKRKSLEFAIQAGHTPKGKKLPAIALQTIVKQFLSPEPHRKIDSPQKSWRATLDSAWIRPEHAKAYELAGQVIGTMHGITIHKPHTLHEYTEAAVAMGKPESALYSRENDKSVITCDWSVPGTSYLSGLVQAINWDSNLDRQPKQ